MHAAISHLMSTVLFVHAALGCCWHQGHDCAQFADSSSEASQCVTCCEHHQCDRHQNPGPCKCKLECQGACQTLPPQKIAVAKVVSASPFDTAVTFAAELSVQVGLARHWEQAPKLADSGRPLRAHLLHQILLI